MSYFYITTPSNIKQLLNNTPLSSLFFQIPCTIQIKAVPLQQQNPPRFPLDQRTRAGLLLFIPMARIYTKLPLSITDQVALLKSRGLQFVDEVAAEKLLSEVCYFRFVQYLRPMEADKIAHIFNPNPVSDHHLCLLRHPECRRP